MNAKTGKLSKTEMATLDKAWGILSRWTEWDEEDAEKHGFEADTDYTYTSAMNAVCGLCEFIGMTKKEW
jgi:phage anti-repressor protein